MPPSICRASALAALLLLGACDGEPAEGPSDTVLDAADASDTTEPGPRLLALDEAGRSAPFLVETDPAAAVLAVRVRPVQATDRCVQLIRAVTAEDEAWVQDAEARRDWDRVCRACSQRVSVAHGWGVFVLPNDGQATVGTESMTLRVAERDCATGLPLDVAPEGRDPVSSLEVEVREVAARPEEAVGTLPVRLVLSGPSGFDAADALEDPVLAEALDRVDAALASAGLRLEVVDVADLAAAPTDPLVYGPAERADLDALLADASAGSDAVPVLIAGCLRREDPVTGGSSHPLGVVPRIPDGWAPEGGGWGVALAGHGCPEAPPGGFWTAPGLATILAHELGHTLGLYHAVEASGAPDHLADTGEDNLMNADPTGHLVHGFSPAQARVMRAHPVVRWDADPAPSTPEP